MFTKNRDRLLTTDVARKVLAAILAHREAAPLLSDEHFPVNGTLVKAWVSAQKFLEDRNRPQASGRLQHRQHPGVENIRKRVRATPAPRRLFVGRQDRIGLQR